MDNRRTLTRGRQKDLKRVELKKSSLRSSPSRRASPSRKSSPQPNRKSPSRRGSPGRKASPSRRASPAPRPSSTTSTRSSRQRSAAVVTPIPVVRPSPIKEKEANISPRVKLDRVNTQILANESIKPTAFITTTTTTSSAHSSFSISTHKTADIGSSKNTSGDSEVAKLTDFIRRSVSKTFSTSQKGVSQTPSTHPSQISRSVSQSVYDDGDNYTKTEFSDSEEENFKSVNMTTKLSYTPLIGKSSSLCRKLEVPKEFGGLLGASVLLITLPILGYYLPWCCKKTVCELQKPNLAVLIDLKYLENVFDKQAIESYVAFSCGVFVLSAALFGRYVRLPNDHIGSGYYFNALPIAVISTILFAIGEYMKYSVADFILKNYLRFCLFSLVNAFFISIWCYTRSFYDNAQNFQVNPYARSENVVIDFSLGKHVNPKWFGRIEIKQVYYKISLIFTLLIAEAYIVKNVQVPLLPVTEKATETFLGKFIFLTKLYIDTVKFDEIALILSTMLLIYVIDGIVFEHHLASSFELQHEGVGALLLFRYAATPFILSIIPKFIFDHKPVKMPLWLVFLMLIVFLSGLIIKRVSSRIKYMYRINPNLAVFNGTETVHTFQGRRLLLGNFWGRVRQPNYAGEILTLSSFLAPLFIKFSWPPLISVLLLIVFILHRATRVSARNSARYHSSWVRYCTRVKYLIIPQIY